MLWIVRRFVLVHRDLLSQGRFFMVRSNDSILSLRRLRDEGVLKAGLHYRALGQGTTRPPLLWDPAATDAALAQRSRRVLNK